MPNQNTPATTAALRARVIEVYVRLVRKLGMHPSLPEMARAGVTRNQITTHFAGITELGVAAKAMHPAAFRDIMDGDLFSHDRFAEVTQQVACHKRYVVTTAITGAKVHAGFLAALRTYCTEHDALLLILPNVDPAAIVSKKRFFDPALHADMIVTRDLRLNRNLFVSSVKLSAKHIDPITGLGRIGQRDGSFIYASPKQRLKMVATGTTGLPHALMTTGACTLPDYDSDRYLSHRTSYIAEHDHVLGAIVVEVPDDRHFHYRQIQADKQGRFADMGRRYSKAGSEEYRPAAMILGDWHSAQNDPVARRVFVEGPCSLQARVKAKAVVVHDGFDALSINHHEEKNCILRAQRAGRNELLLKPELSKYAGDLNMLDTFFEQTWVVRSNHDEALDRYLREGRYLYDAPNHGTALCLAQAMVDAGANPVEVGVRLFGLRPDARVTFLTRDSSLRIGGVELAGHGDKGANGSRGSLRAMENAFGSSVSGHAHTPEILRRARQVGTCSILDPDYVSGPSSWLTTSALLYPDGAVQLINVIEGAYCA